MSRFESTEPRRARCVAPCFVQRRGDQAEREKRRLRHVSEKLGSVERPNPDRRYSNRQYMHVCIKYFHRFCMCADVAHHMGDEPPRKKHTHTNHARTQRTHTRHTHTHHTRSIRALALAFMLVRPSLAPSSESLPAASAPLHFPLPTTTLVRHRRPAAAARKCWPACLPHPHDASAAACRSPRAEVARSHTHAAPCSHAGARAHTRHCTRSPLLRRHHGRVASRAARLLRGDVELVQHMDR